MIISVFLNLILIFVSSVFSFNQVVLYSGDIYHFQPEVVSEKITAQKAAVLTEDGRYLLFSKDSEDVQPIASITKLMTALVFLETNPDFTDTYKITPDDYVLGGRLHLFTGDIVNLHDLFLTSLVASDNGATIALVHASGLSEKEFVARMNEKAKELRLEHTSFVDPVGLSQYNVSTAKETAILALRVFNEEEIRKAMSLKEYSFQTLQGRDKYIESTDYLLFDDEENSFVSLGGKTGYTDKAGYCFVGIFAGPNGEILAASVLNSDDKNGRFKESKEIIRWTLENYFLGN